MIIFPTGDLAMDGFSGSFVFSPVNRVTARYITITAMSANSQTGSLIRGVRSGMVNCVVKVTCTHATHTHAHTHTHTQGRLHSVPLISSTKGWLSAATV